MKLGAQEAIVEARVVRDKDCAFEPIEHKLRDFCERRCRTHHVVGDAGEPLNLGRNRHARVDQRRPFVDAHIVAVKIDAHDADFGHTLARRARSGRFDIDEGQAWSERGKHCPELSVTQEGHTVEKSELERQACHRRKPCRN